MNRLKALWHEEQRIAALMLATETPLQRRVRMSLGLFMFVLAAAVPATALLAPAETAVNAALVIALTAMLLAELHSRWRSIP